MAPEGHAMRTAAKWIGVACAVLWASATLGACSTDDSALDNTFSCSGGATTLRCIAATQYCERAMDGATSTGAACRSIPSTGCSGNPCNNCLMMGTNGIITCTAYTLGSSYAATAVVRR
jgi:hypothetical protein